MADAKKKKVLIVDDDEFLLDMYVVKFKEAGFEVDIAQNGEEALAKVRAGNPDVVLLDVVMPKMDGFDVLRTIKKEKLAPHAAVFVLSNLGQKEDTDRGMNLGAVDYIVKAHFTPSEVVARVNNVLQSHTH